MTPIFDFFSFGSLEMLILGAAAAVPILIHLWTKRKYNQVPWAAMAFLLAAIQRNARRIRIEQFVLLAIRVLMLLLLAIAMSDISCNWSAPIGSSLGSRSRTHTILVMDASYSMAYRQADRSRFERAQRLAISLVEDSRQGDGFTLVMMGDPPKEIISSPAFDPRDIVAEINALQVQHSGADLAGTLAQVHSILQAARSEHARLTQCKICFFTDLGETTWSAVSTPECAQWVKRLADQASLVSVDLGQGGGENIAVTALRSSEAFVTVSRDVQFEANIRNFGHQDRTGHVVKFFVDGQTEAVERIDLQAGSQATVGFTHRFSGPGEHRVHVRIGDDLLDVDNTRWLSVPVRESVRVLCVGGRHDAARFVTYALEPRESDQPRVRAEMVAESALLELDLASYDCVVLCNIGRFGPDEAGVLYDLLVGGGGLIVFLGDQVVASSYNQMLVEKDPDRRILPARIGTTVPLSQYRFDPRGYQHPIVKPFQGNEQAGLLTTPIWKYVKLMRVDPSRASIALAFDNGDPAIMEEPLLNGRSILVATAASTSSVDRTADPAQSWTALSTWHSFPPLVHEMLALAISGRFGQRNVVVGEALRSWEQRTSANATITVVDPRGQSERIRMSSMGSQDGHWVFRTTETCGIYEAHLDAHPSEVQFFAANVNTQESKLEGIDPDQLPDPFNRDSQKMEQGSSLAGMDPRSQLFRYFLAGVLVLLFLETFLAWLFGTART